MIATAKNLHSIHKTLAAPQGKRFFARIEEIGALEEVCFNVSLNISLI